MRNIVKICIAMAMILVMAAPCFATNFVPSIQEKPSPGLVIMGEDGTGEWFGEIIDENGNVIFKLYEEDIIVTPLGDIDDADIPQAAKDLLKEVYKDLLNGETSLDDIPGLIETLKEALGEDASGSDLTIKDLFDVTIVNPEALGLLEDGNKLKIIFDLGADLDEFLAVMEYAEEWGLVYDFEVNEDGTVTVILNGPGPVAFLTATRDLIDDEKSPATGDTTNIALWAGVGVGAAALLLLLMRKRQNN